MQGKLTTRKKIRLEGYDYSNEGYYFITICVKEKYAFLGEIVGAMSGRPQIRLSVEGKIAESWIHKISGEYRQYQILEIQTNYMKFTSSNIGK